MAIPIWPPELPQKPQRDSFTRTGQDSRWKFEPDAGPVYVRQMGRKGDKLSMTFVMTREQTVVLRNFYHDILKDGSLCFAYPDPDDDTTLTVRFDTGSDPYAIRARGIDREVSVVWEIMP